MLNQFGGRVGGPISVPKLFDGRDKAFFFVNYEEYRLPEQVTRQRTILNPITQQGVFQYNTSSGVQRVNLLQLAQTAGCSGCTATLDPTVAKLLADIQQSTTTTGTSTLGPGLGTSAVTLVSPYCHTAFGILTQLRGFSSYEIPKVDVEFAATFQSKPGPMLAATCATLTGASKCLTAPSGKRMSGMALLQKKVRDEPHFSKQHNRACELATRSTGLRARQRCHNHAFLLPDVNAPRLAAVDALFFDGRRDWTRTNDPHHVKVVL